MGVAGNLSPAEACSETDILTVLWGEGDLDIGLMILPLPMVKLLEV